MNAGAIPSQHLTDGRPVARLGVTACALVVLVVAFTSSQATPWRLASLLLLAPLLEEIVFRAGLQEALLRRRWPAAAANLATALAFGAAHLAAGSWQLALARVLPALVIGRVYQRQRRLAPCVAWHAIFNATWLIATAALPPSLLHRVLP